MGKASRKIRAAFEFLVSQYGKSGPAEHANSSLLNNRIVHLYLIAVIGFIAYSNTFHASFHFDDTSYIIDNPVIRDLGFFFEPSRADGLKGYLVFGLKERYVGFLTLALNYRIGGLDVPGYHVFNLAVHLTNALLVYLLTVMSFSTPFLRRSFTTDRAELVAFFAALLFVCHPVQTQAVTYIWQRVTSVATAFYLLSLVLYIKWRISDRLSSRPLVLYVASVVGAVLAMKTKEIAFTLPVVIMLYEFMFFEGRTKKRLLHLIPLLLTICIIPLTFLRIDKPVGEMVEEVSESLRAGTDMSRTTYMFTQWRVIATYMRLLFLPARQNLDYDYPVYNSLFSPEVFLSFLFLASVIGAGIYIFCRYRKAVPQTRLISFGVFWFFIVLSVESSIIPIQDVIFEHRVYLPSVGAFIAVTTFLIIAKDKLAHKRMKIEKAIIPGLSLIVVVFAGATYMRNVVWQDEVNLWSDVVEKSPLKARGHYNLGNAYKNKGWIDKAVEQYETAVKLKPDYAKAYYNLGLAYQSKGRLDKAIEQYETAVKLKPDYAKAHNNLGLVYHNKGWIDKAIEQYEIALKLSSDLVEARNNLGLAYQSKGRIDKAIEQYETAVKLKPDYAKAHYNLGLAYASKGLKLEAAREFEKALKIRADFTQAREALGSINR